MEIRGWPNEETTSKQEEILTWGSRRPKGPGRWSPRCIVRPRLAAASSTHAPGGSRAPDAPAARTAAAALGGYSGTFPGERCEPRVTERDSRSTLAQVAQRGLSTERVNKLPRHLPPQPPNRLLRTPSARLRSREALATSSLPQPGDESFCLGRDEHNDP